MDDKMIKNKAQITIFIIVGIILVSLVVLFFLFREGGISESRRTAEVNPNSFLDSCMEDKIKETTKILYSQGGYITNPLNITFKFSDENEYSDISYLCYNQNYYFQCINQEPLLIQHLKREVHDYIYDDVRNCFDDLTMNLEKQGYVVDARYDGFEVELVEKKIVVNIDGELTLTKSEETLKKKDFEIIVPTKFYDLAIVVQEIVSQEAEYGNFDELGFMIIYPEFKIIKFKTGDSKIYRVKDKKTQEEFKFAIRTSVIPPRL